MRAAYKAFSSEVETGSLEESAPRIKGFATALRQGGAAPPESRSRP
jgi:hypothetical protein